MANTEKMKPLIKIIHSKKKDIDVKSAIQFKYWEQDFHKA